MNDQIKFAVVSDTHFYARAEKNDKATWNLPLSKMSKEIGEAMVADINQHRPDFVIHCGDLAGRCDVENFEFAKQMMDMLNCAWYAVPGNHDTWYNHDAVYDGLREKFSALYDLPLNICHYSKIIKGMLFLFVDNCYWIQKNKEYTSYLYKDIYDSGQILGQYLPPFEMEWMKQELDTFSDLPTVIVCHNPPAIKPGLLVKSGGNGKIGYVNGVGPVPMNAPFYNCNEMLDVLSGYKNVKAVFCGHYHINDFYKKSKIALIQTCSMREFPFEYRIVDVKDNMMRIKTFGLEDKRFADLSFVPDNKNKWIRGKKNDREITVHLNSSI